MIKKSTNHLFLFAGLMLCTTGTALAQSVGGACATTGQMFVSNAANPAKILVCNSGTWALAEQINANGIIGIDQASPQATLDVNGGLRVNADVNGCSASNSGEMMYTSNQIYFCNGTAWSALGASVGASGCGTITSGTCIEASGPCASGGGTPDNTTVTVQPNCTVVFKAWGGGGGGGSSGNAQVGGNGGGGGYATLTLGTSGSAVTYFIGLGKGGASSLATPPGGTAYGSMQGGAGKTSTGSGGGGGGATGIWITNTSGVLQLVAAGGAGGQGGSQTGSVGGGDGTAGGCGGTQNGAANGANATSSNNAGGGGGYSTGGAINIGGSDYAVSNGGIFCGNGIYPGGYSDSNYPSGVGMGGAGSAANATGTAGAAGGVYWQTY